MVGMNVQYLPEKHSAIFDTNTASHISFDCKRKDTLCIPIDSIDLPVKINLAKIDVEGYEIHVLHGMKKMIKRDRPVLIVENNSIDINQFLLEMGYEMTKMDENSRNEVYIFNN